MAIDSGCLCVISNKPCAHPHTLLLPDTTDALEGTNRIREAYIKVSAYIRSLHKAKVITVTGSVGKTSTKEMNHAQYSEPQADDECLSAGGRRVRTENHRILGKTARG